jgi:hypothetical protein
LKKILEIFNDEVESSINGYIFVVQKRNPPSDQLDGSFVLKI